MRHCASTCPTPACPTLHPLLGPACKFYSHRLHAQPVPACHDSQFYGPGVGSMTRVLSYGPGAETHSEPAFLLNPLCASCMRCTDLLNSSSHPGHSNVWSPKQCDTAAVSTVLQHLDSGRHTTLYFAQHMCTVCHLLTAWSSQLAGD